MKVIEQEKKQFEPVSLVMENIGDLEDVKCALEDFINHIARSAGSPLGIVAFELEKILLRYKTKKEIK